uniref:LysM receptor kinase n=1 Tax=Datisca glomerata TaxID=34297 RepID=A0A3Q8TMV9_DATGL|nr:LysM receptor kinase [Datisca glomerata]
MKASFNSLSCLFFLVVFAYFSDISSSISNETMSPMTCSSQNKPCNASLYHINNGLNESEIASSYSVKVSQIRTIMVGSRQDYLISVPCSCQAVNGISAYFYSTFYNVQIGDSSDSISEGRYNGQAFMVGKNQTLFPGKNSVQLLCGCVESESEIVVTYTVQRHDTLSQIATLLSAHESNIESLNRNLIKNPQFIDEGWVLFVPMEKNGILQPTSTKEKSRQWIIIVGILSAVSIISICSLIIIILRRKRLQQSNEEDPKLAVSKSLSGNRNFSLQHLSLNKENMQDAPGFKTEKPVVFTIEQIEEATNNFDETQKIGEGGYGTVYFGVIGDQEIAVKKMKSNKSKEFLIELRVLCKIHHINVVELLGYASGDDHLYLIYEFVQNGSLSDHLHDPLLKGYQPLSWTARTQIALDAAKGIEYIHDHTKAQYVHRDIKTTNILLDESLRAKVADFGLAKLVGRTNEDDLIATRLVGTPGYLPPESVKELQVTPKTDVFAFGVVLAELITGTRALVRDKQEPNKTKSLIKLVNKIFEDEDPETALEASVDGNLQGNYPFEDAYKMAEIAAWCLSEDAVNRPEMREIVTTLSQIVQAAIEWEASLGGNSQVFSGLFSGR